MRQAKAIEIFDYPIESIYSTNQYQSVPFTVPIDQYSVNDVENISYEIRSKNKSQELNK